MLSPVEELVSIALKHNALQHGPRPLPLFLHIAQQQLAGEPAKLQKLLAALSIYQHAARPGNVAVPTPILRQGKASLRAPAHIFSGTIESQQTRSGHVIFVPSPINSPAILDLDRERSLMAWLTAQGWSCGLVDWGQVTPDSRDENLDSYVTDYLLPMLAQLDGPVHLVGYCLGGMIAMAAACLMPVASLTLIAAPWHFSGHSAQRRQEITAVWRDNEAHCDTLGLVPMEIMQAGFWALSPANLVEKYLAFGKLGRDTADYHRFIRMEDWANGGEALPLAMGRQLFEHFYGDDISGTGDWRIKGTAIAPANLPCPALEIASSTDEIVPLASSPAFRNRIILNQGHVGMVVGRRAYNGLWRVLSDWLAEND